MSDNQPTIRLRVLASAAALMLALLGVVALWGTANAADGTATPAATGCAMASATKGDPAGTPTADAKCVEVDAHDIYWSANLITIPADTDVKFEIRNEGAAAHTFVINDHNNKDVKNLEINEALDPGSTTEVTINAPAGTYYFWCDIPGHEQAGMWGILKVEDNGKISAQSVDDPKSA
ncbi:MAG TPA: cupredoxin domain-containing protein [Thermomicrobiales bacterium]|jgi:uncharacterized cupredoxin-like copper-binding protein|nr:cupredoxin domain-containing protein [Thermomicrobiales bacterium]